MPPNTSKSRSGSDHRQHKEKQSPLTNYYNMSNNMRQPLRTSTDTSPMEELQWQPQSTRSGPSSTGKVKAKEPKGKICGKCGMSHSPRECPAWGKKCHKCGNKTISVHSVGLSSQGLGTENPVAHPEDIRAEVSHIIPG